MDGTCVLKRRGWFTVNHGCGYSNDQILGWDILTVTTVPAGTTGVAATSPVVVQADVIRVYEFTDFNSLFGLFN